jgi:hypothetical protein
MFAGSRGGIIVPSLWPSTRYVAKYVVADAVSGESTVTRMLVHLRRDRRSVGRDPK